MIERFINLFRKDKKVFIGNTFTINGIDEDKFNVKVEEISWEEFDKYREGDHINYMGHEDVAKFVGMEMNRISIHAYKGDTIIVPQYIGPRLPEGTTVLPEGAVIVPKKITIW